MKRICLRLVLIGLVLMGCSGSDENIVDNSDGNPSDPYNDPNDYSGWLIPVNEVIDGGPGKDGIPSIDSPKFIFSEAVQYLDDNDLVIGLMFNNEQRVYPHKFLDWHEIVNDQFNGSKVTINYCPLTGTAFGWKGFFENNETTFGVSGLLYNANLILYDRATDSNWSQLKLQCVNGARQKEEPELLNTVELPWKVWKSLYPNSKVLSTDTGYSRNYDNYPYGPYNVDHDFFIFPVSPLNLLLPSKERVFAIIDNEMARVYRLNQFVGGKATKVSFNGKDFLLVGDERFIIGFELDEVTKGLDFSYEMITNDRDEGSLFTDNEGNKWSLFGEVLEGNRKGYKLNHPKSVMSYWFAIAAFYPNPILYE